MMSDCYRSMIGQCIGTSNSSLTTGVRMWISFRVRLVRLAGVVGILSMVAVGDLDLRNRLNADDGLTSVDANKPETRPVSEFEGGLSVNKQFIVPHIAAAVCPVEGTLAASHAGGHVVLWGPRGEILRRWRLSNGRAADYLRWSRSGDFLFGVSSDGTFSVWDRTTGGLIVDACTITADSARQADSELSEQSNGDHRGIENGDGTVDAHDNAEPSEDVPLQQTGVPTVMGVSVSEDAQLLVLAFSDHRLIAIHTGLGRDDQAGAGKDANQIEIVWSVQIEPAIQTLADAVESHVWVGDVAGTVQAVSVTDGTIMHQWPGGSESIQAILELPNSHELVVAPGVQVGSSANQLATIVWDIEDVTAPEVSERYVTTQGGPASLLAVSRDGMLWGAAGLAGEIRLWDVASGEQLLVQASERVPLTSFGISSADQHWVLTTNLDHYWTVRREAIPVREATRSFAVESRRCWSFSLSPDESQVAVGGSNGYLAILDLENGEVITQLSGFPGSIDVLDWSPDGRMIAACGWKVPKVMVWDVSTRELVLDASTQREKNEDAQVRCVKFSRGSGRLYCGTNSGRFWVWPTSRLPTDSAQPEGTSIEITKEAVYAIDTCEFDQTILACTGDWQSGARGIVVRIDPETEPPTLEPVVMRAPLLPTLRDIDVHPSGLFVVGGMRREVRLQDLNAPLTGITLINGTETRSVAISPSRNLLAIGQTTRTINIWDLQSRTIVDRLRTPAEPFTMTFTNDGKMLFAVCGKAELLSWTMPSEPAGE